MKSYSNRTLFVQLSLCLSVSACGLLQTTPTIKSQPAKPVVTKPAPVKDMIYVVVPGDTLRGISVQTTGNTQHWDVIAGHNKMVYPYALRIDQQIRIPGRLLLAKPVIKVQQPSTPKPVAKPSKDGPPIAKRPAAKTPAVASVGQLGSQSKDGPPTSAIAKPASGSGWITITGSYYPREVKMQPSSGADYLMLVRPGSRIRYIARQGDWYKVITERGEGYVQADYALEQ